MQQYMNLGNNPVFVHWAFQFLVVLFLVGGLAVLAAGIGLIFYSGPTLRLFAYLNRWISTRRVFKPLDVTHDTQGAAQKYRYPLGLLFIVGGAYSIYGLATGVHPTSVIYLFGLNALHPAVASWIVDSAKWLLIIGNVAAFVAGVMLCFFPRGVAELEARGAHWYSDRRLAKGGDTMHVAFDKWVVASPRAAGCVMAVCAVILVGAFGSMLPKI
jgi:hypothetical protein